MDDRVFALFAGAVVWFSYRVVVEYRSLNHENRLLL